MAIDGETRTDESFLEKHWLGVCITMVIIITLAVVIYGGIILWFTWPVSELSVNMSGVFGDSFGLLTSLFSGLAFGGLIITILLQRSDLQHQREELRLTRFEMKSQNFENTFFQMLRLHNELVNSIDISRDNHGNQFITTGRDCFTTFSKRLVANFKSLEANRKDLTLIENVEFAYTVFYKNHQHELGHYFRYLYRIFKFIHDSDIDNKKLYSGIARAQLSNQELYLLFYNCLSEHGVERFKPLVEEFQLFDNLPLSILACPEHAEFYSLKAWREN